MKELHVCLLAVKPDVLQTPCPSSSNFSVVLLLMSLPCIGSTVTKRDKGFHTDTGIHIFIVLQSCKYLPDLRGHKIPRRIWQLARLYQPKGDNYGCF